MKPEEAIDRLEYLEDALDGYLPETGINDVFAAINTAIEALKEINLYKNNGLCLVPIGVYEKQCKELDEYKEIGTVEECREAVEKQKRQKYGTEGQVNRMKMTYENCSLQKRIGRAGKDGNGMCMGFGRSDTDDEPCEICKKCKLYTGNEGGMNE